MYPFLDLATEKAKQTFVDDVILSACTGQQVVAAVHAWAMREQNLADVCKAKIALLVCDTETRLIEGGRDDINLLLFFEKLARIMQTK